MRTVLIVTALVLAAATPATAQVPGLPPILPPGGTQPPPAPPDPHPGPIGTAPGSVSDAVDAAHTGFFADDALVPPLVKRWQVASSVPPETRVLAADGRVYTVNDQALVALDQADGHQIWSQPLPVVPLGVAYDAGAVYVALGTSIAAYKADTGAQLWRASATKSDYSFGQPVAGGGAIYAMANDEMTAFRESDGAILWTAPVPNGVVAALDDQRVYAAGPCGQVWALNRSDGQPAWKHDSGCTGGGGAVPLLFGGRLYDSAPAPGGGAPILDVANGNPLGTYPGGRAVVVDGLLVYTDPGSIHALDIASGAERWKATRRRPGTSWRWGTTCTRS